MTTVCTQVNDRVASERLNESSLEAQQEPTLEPDLSLTRKSKNGCELTLQIQPVGA